MIRIVKCTIIFVFLLSSLIAITGETGETCAHTPSNMKLDYDIDNHTLNVTITHSVSNPDTHYIYKIETKKNDVLQSTKEYTSQPSTSKFTYSIDVATEMEDKLTITALCNQVGSIKKSYIVNGGEEDGGGIAGFEMILVLGAMMVLLMLKRKK